MDSFLIIIGFGIFYFLLFSLSDVIESGHKTKLKIAEANRDAEKYRLETARINSNK